MSEGWEKYILRQSVSIRKKLLIIAKKIRLSEFEDLDCKKLQGFENIFRVRAGKFRIVFEKKQNRGIILEINTRGDIY